jgi:Breast carcinoma amplified sequence 2 (BCAS2)
MLEYHANQNYLVFENENANLVTSLPYIDEDADPKYTDRVQELIRQEMQSMRPPRDYLTKIPLPETNQLVRLLYLLIVVY